MSYAIAQNRRQNNNCPTHRNELTHLGQIYLGSSCDKFRVTNGTVRLLIDFYNDIFYRISAQYAITPSPHHDASATLAQINYNVREKCQYVVFNGGSHSVLGFDTIVERVVHDYIHYRIQAETDLDGEYLVFFETAKLLELYAKKQNFVKNTILQAVSILYSEIYLQACAHDFLEEFPKEQKIILTDTPYRLKFN